MLYSANSHWQYDDSSLLLLIGIYMCTVHINLSLERQFKTASALKPRAESLARAIIFRLVFGWITCCQT